MIRISARKRLINMSGPQTFKDYLFDKFLEWEKTQPNRRSNFSAFARWLCDNTFGIEVKQQTMDSWMSGSVPKDDKYLVVLAEKLGDDVYTALERKKVNIHLFRLIQRWENIPDAFQKKIEEDTAIYEKKNLSKRISKASKPRKARKPN